MMKSLVDKKGPHRREQREHKICNAAAALKSIKILISVLELDSINEPGTPLNHTAPCHDMTHLTLSSGTSLNTPDKKHHLGTNNLHPMKTPAY